MKRKPTQEATLQSDDSTWLPEATTAAAVADDLLTMHKEAITLIARGKLNDAFDALEEVYAKEPRGPLADNALYWMGSIQFDQRDYGSAIRTWQRVVDDYSDASHAPHSMVRIGLAHAALGERDLARRTFTQVILAYTESDAAVTARRELDRLPK